MQGMEYYHFRLSVGTWEAMASDIIIPGAQNDQRQCTKLLHSAKARERASLKPYHLETGFIL
jgi:hypothetical protein